MNENIHENTRMTIPERLNLHKKWLFEETNGARFEEHGTNLREKNLRIGDFPREIRKWDVGERIGEQIRVIRRRERDIAKDDADIAKDDTSDVADNATPPRRYKNRPHIRRAHWHHYWTGEGRTKLILKWVSTIFVNPEDGEADTTIIKL